MTDQPTSLPGITLTGVLGRGGFATVHRGRDEVLHRDVAVKIDSRVITDERDRRRFLREATATTRIADHPHVITVFSAGVTADSRPYLVMELCEGGSIADRLRSSGPLPPAEVLDIAIAISSALASAHGAGILHRDLKPGNILIDRYGTPRLTDFGLASLSTDGDLSVTLEALTPAYAPPEVIRQQQPTTASDVWSLAATLTTMLTGRHPRLDQSGRSLSLTTLATAPDTPVTPARVPGAEGLVAVLARATDPDPARRQQDGAELHQDLLAVRRDGLAVVPASLAAATPTRVLAPAALAAAPLASAATPAARTRSRAALWVVPAVLLLVLGGWWAATQLDPAPAAPGAGSVTSGRPTATTSGPATSRPEPSSPASSSTSAPSTEPPSAAAPSAPAPSAPATSAVSTVPSGPAAEPIVPSVGDCWAEDDDGWALVDCSQPHLLETFATGDLDQARSDDFDEDPAVQQACTDQALANYLGSPRSNLEIGVLGPTDAGAGDDQRWFACVVAPRNGDPTTGSLKQG